MGRIEAFVIDTAYFYTALYSFIASFIIFYIVGPVLSSRYIPSYNTILDNDKKITWNSYVLSTIHGIVVSLYCICGFLFDPQLSQEPIWWDSPIVRSGCAIVCGYAIADIVMVILHYKQIGEIGFILHHISTIFAYFFVMSYGVLAYFANFRLMAEFSTTFVNLRWMLSALNYSKTSNLFFINGLLMMGSFYIVRVFILPLYWYKVFSIYGIDDNLGYLWHVMFFTSILLDILNIYWAYRMYLGARKVVKLKLDDNKNETIKSE